GLDRPAQQRRRRSGMLRGRVPRAAGVRGGLEPVLGHRQVEGHPVIVERPPRTSASPATVRAGVRSVGWAMRGWRQRYHDHITRWYGPDPRNAWLSWIGDERIAVGSLPTGATLPRLAAHGVTHIVNCRATQQTWVSQDLAAERALLGPARVAHAPMWDSGQPQAPRRWSAAAHFAARALTEDDAARVFVHCHQGRRRSI